MPSARNIRSWSSRSWIRMLPDASSQPLRVTSYDLLMTLPGSVSRYSSVSSTTPVKGWWIGFHRFSSSSYSNHGKSVIHANFHAAGSLRANSGVIPKRSASRVHNPVELLTSQRALSGHHNRLDRAVAFENRTEDLYFCRREHIRKVRQLHSVAEVGLVRPETLHRLGVGQAREGVHVHTEHFLPYVSEHPFGDIEHVVHFHERHLEVELGEVRLAVGAQILVTEAPGDLVIAVEARHHQQLLEELRRLGQGIKPARMNTRRNEIVAR